jgi:hypothetical protein
MTQDSVVTKISLRQRVEDESEALVNYANQTMSPQQVQVLKKRGTQLRLSQLNNLLGVALETSSPAVVVNWLGYQMGRYNTRDGWKRSGLGSKILQDIQRLQQTAEQVARDVFGEQSEERIRQAHIALLRLYFGYLRRWFVARGGQE